jgi:hypothetical protein
MTRQGVTQHLDVLEAANLVATVRRGREKLHFLNPVPLQAIYERWIAKFEKPRLKALHDLKRRLDTTMARSTFVYDTYIRTTPGEHWSALTDAEFMKQYWFGQAVSGGWPKVISNLKSLLETGSVVLPEPYPVESTRA